MIFTEKIRWSLPVWLFLLFLSTSFGWAVWAAFTVTAALTTFAIICVGLIFAYYRNTLIIRCDHNWLYVGRAKIERKYLGNIEKLNSELMARARGRELDPAAYLALRFWVKGGLRISINDPRDPTPYWLLSSRKTNELFELLS